MDKQQTNVFKYGHTQNLCIPLTSSSMMSMLIKMYENQTTVFEYIKVEYSFLVQTS